MANGPLSTASVVVLLCAVVVGGALLYVHSAGLYSTPQATAAAVVKAAAAGDLGSICAASTSGYCADLIGNFGQQEYEQVRAAYQEAFDRAMPPWMEYRQRAESAAEAAFRRLRDEVDRLGRNAVAKLSVDERMHLTEDRAKYSDFVFQEGLKALPAEERKKIEDPAAFRSGLEFPRFAAREGWALLSADDQKALGNPAVLAPELTREKMQFLAKTGVEMLSKEQKEAIAGISPDELSLPRDFMLKHGEPPAKSFLSQAAIASSIQVTRCAFPDEEQKGSLLRGDTASCAFTMSVRGETYAVTALLRKAGFDWKVDFLEPDFFEMPAAYPPKQAAASTAPVGGYRQAKNYQQPERIERVRLARARWDRHAAPQPPAALNAFLGMARRAAVSPLLWGGFAVLFIVIMTVNYLRLRNATFLPEWLEGEQQLDELVLPGWWMRTITRLTNRRVLQVRLNWFLSKHKIHAIALDDIHSVVWRRYTNWFLIALGVYMVGRFNPVALLLVMLGLEAKIHSIRFNTPFAQMLRTNAVVTSFRRKHFNQLAAFYRKAQLHWAQVRTQKQIPVPTNTAYEPEVDRDFFWGIPLWLYAGVWMVLALGQRMLAKHVTLDDLLVASLLLGLSAGIAHRSGRDAMLAAVLGLTAFLSVKFPGRDLFGVALGPDGDAPYFEQYLGVLVALFAISAAAIALARISPLAGLFTPILWVGFVAWFKPVLAQDFSLYARCALAAAAAVLWSWIDATIRRERESPAPATAASARGAAA